MVHSSTYFLRLAASETTLSAEMKVSTLFLLTASFPFPLWHDLNLATSFHSISLDLEGEDGGLDAIGDRGVLRILDEAAVGERLALDHVRGGAFHRDLVRLGQEHPLELRVESRQRCPTGRSHT